MPRLAVHLALPEPAPGPRLQHGHAGENDPHDGQDRPAQFGRSSVMLGQGDEDGAAQ
jgi:hypothetical protein